MLDEGVSDVSGVPAGVSTTGELVIASIGGAAGGALGGPSLSQSLSMVIGTESSAG